MPRTSTAPVCEIHNEPMVKIKGKYYCQKCLYSSHLTYETQKQAIQRYNKSPEGRDAAKRYEQSEKGKLAREKYLKSEKYKAARKAYNERLRESLAMARAAQGAGERAKELTPTELRVATSLEGLMAEIREYIDSNMRPPSVQNVINTAKKDYNQVIDTKKAEELINDALQRRSRSQKV